MNIKDSVKNIIFKPSQNRIINKRKLTTSYVSLFLVLTILIGATVSWFTFSNTSSVKSDTFTLESASGLRVNEGESISNHITLDNIRLDEVSSIDGRNVFIPTTGTFSDDTASMYFREGNVGDKNNSYVYKDFTLKGDSATTYTYVYVKSYNITVGDEVFNGSTDIQYKDGKPVSQTKHEECPIRIAFITDSSKTPQVIDSTALIDNYAKLYNAVSLTNDSGSASTEISSAVSFSDYYFVTGSPIFTLKNNTPLDVTMVVWLEGTENTKTGTSVSEKYAGKDISIDIELESNWDDMETITFTDETLNDDVGSPEGATPSRWINSSNDAIILMSYKDDEGIVRTVVMSESGDYSWIAPIPKDVTTDISFYRYSISDEIIYNAWHTKVGVNDELNPAIKSDANWIGYYGDLQESRIVNGNRSVVYTAVRGNNYGEVSEDDPQLEVKRLSPCLGYWDYNTPVTEPTTVVQTTTSAATTTTPLDPEQNISLKVYAERINSRVQGLISSGYKFCVVFYDGSVEELTGSGDYYKNESIKVAQGAMIRGFSLIDSSGATYEDFALTDGFVSITSDINITFQMQDDETMKKL